jgi:o-succinylbenzoate synthase
MILTDIALDGFETPMRQPLFFRKREGVLIHLRADHEGQCIEAVGEASPLRHFSDETLAQVWDQAQQLATDLKDCTIGDDLETFYQLSEEWLSALYPSVRFGIESAIITLFAQASGLSIRGYLGGDSMQTVPVSALLDSLDKRILEKAADLAENGFSTVKVKVGRQEVERDIQIIQQLSEISSGAFKLRIDPNRKWDWAAAITFGSQCSKCHIDYVEEPMPLPWALPEWFDACGIPYALDETVVEQGAALDFDAYTGLHALILKPTLLGGVRSTLNLAWKAHKKGVAPILSSSFESGPGLRFLANMATVMPASQQPAGLDTFSWFIEPDPILKAFSIVNGEIPLEPLDLVQVQIPACTV